MKIKKTNDNNSINTYRTKKLISIILAATSVFSLASCKSEEEKKDYTLPPETSSSTFIEGDSEKYDEFYTEVAPEEMTQVILEQTTANNEEINYQEIINEINKLNYNSNYSVFNDYDILKRPSLEKEQIIAQNLNQPMNEKDYANRNYDWYINGKVNEEKLYDKIIKNNFKRTGISDSNAKLIAKTIAETVQVNLDFMSEKYPNYNLDIALYGIDNLTVQDYPEGDFICFMDYGKIKVFVNFNNVNDISTLKYSMSHELFHLIFSKSLNRDDVIINGCGIDAMNTDESPLYAEFLSEHTVESYSHEAFGNEDPCDYWDNYMLTDLLCLSTGKDRQYFKDCFVNNNNQGLINCFENGMNSFNTALSIYDAIDIGLGYGDVTKELKNRGDFDIASVQGEALNYVKFNLYKNLLIRLTNELQQGKISMDEAQMQIDEFKNRVFNIENNITWVNSDKNNYSDSIAKLDGQFNKLQKNKIYA